MNGELKIKLASFKASMQLKKAISRAIKNSDLDVSGIDLDFKKIDSSSLESIIQIILSIDSSEEVEQAIFDCLQRCTYNQEKITRETFEEEKAREDYYEIVIECLKINLRPFLKPLFSKFAELQEKINLKNQK